MLFQVNPCNYLNCTIPAYGFCIVVGNGLAIGIGNCMDESAINSMAMGKSHKAKPNGCKCILQHLLALKACTTGASF